MNLFPKVRKNIDLFWGRAARRLSKLGKVQWNERKRSAVELGRGMNGHAN